MRIVMISSYFAPYLYGGAEVYLQNLVGALKNRGHEVIVITNNPGKVHADPAVINLDITPNIGLRALLMPQPNIVNEIRRHIALICADIVHIHCTHTTLGFAPFIAVENQAAVATMHEYSAFCLTGKNARVEGEVCNDRRYCVDCAASFYPQEILRVSNGAPGRVAAALMHNVRPLNAAVVGIRNASKAQHLTKTLRKVICPSEAVAETMRIWGFPPSRLCVVPNGIPDPGLPHRPAITERREMRVGFVGRLVAAKGVHLLIEAVAALRRAGHPVELIVAGDGEARHDLEKQAQRELGAGYEFRGWLDAARLESAYRDIDVMAFPVTWVEAFGIALLEAMARRIPVVASSIGGIPEVLANGGGRLFKSGSVLELTDALTSLLDPSKRTAMGNQGRQAFLEHFTLQTNVNAIESIYRNVRLAK